jgi:hypothetical protein
MVQSSIRGAPPSPAQGQEPGVGQSLSGLSGPHSRGRDALLQFEFRSRTLHSAAPCIPPRLSFVYRCPCTVSSAPLRASVNTELTTVRPATRSGKLSDALLQFATHVWGLWKLSSMRLHQLLLCRIAPGCTLLPKKKLTGANPWPKGTESAALLSSSSSSDFALTSPALHGQQPGGVTLPCQHGQRSNFGSISMYLTASFLASATESMPEGVVG